MLGASRPPLLGAGGKREGEGSRATGTYISQEETQALCPLFPRHCLARETQTPGPCQAGAGEQGLAWGQTQGGPRAGWGLGCVWSKSLTLRWHQGWLGWEGGQRTLKATPGRRRG